MKQTTSQFPSRQRPPWDNAQPGDSPATTATTRLCHRRHDYVSIMSQSQSTTVLSRARFFRRPQLLHL